MAVDYRVGVKRGTRILFRVNFITLNSKNIEITFEDANINLLNKFKGN